MAEAQGQQLHMHLGSLGAGAVLGALALLAARGAWARLSNGRFFGNTRKPKANKASTDREHEDEELRLLVTDCDEF